MRTVAFIIIYMFNWLPIKHNKIFLFSYYGSQFGCNPKYITTYINHHYPPGMFDVVWAFNDPKSKDRSSQIRKVKTMSLRYFYELCTAKVVITNFRTTELYVKRKNQYYIQTWHSSLRLKQIEKDAARALPRTYIQMAQADSLKCDLLLSGCQTSTEIFKRSFWYDGEIFEHGTPRNDVLLQNNRMLKRNVLKNLNLPSHMKVLLYAPTFRKDEHLHVYHIDYRKLTQQLRNKFGGEWIILVKFHPHVADRATEFIGRGDVMNVTSYDDIQELLVVADVLISDYSSLIFDYAITNRPCFLYIPDIKTYTQSDRKLYFNVMDLPFIHATSNAELLTKIDQFSSTEYQNHITRFLSDVGSFEKGEASEQLLKRIEAICFNKEGDETYEVV